MQVTSENFHRVFPRLLLHSHLALSLMLPRSQTPGPSKPSGASAAPVPISAMGPSSTRSPSVPQSDTANSMSNVDFEDPYYSDALFGRRFSPPGLKRIIMKPLEMKEFVFPDVATKNSFYFLDHPVVADLALYARNPRHVRSQRPGDIEELFRRAEPIFVSPEFNIFRCFCVFKHFQAIFRANFASVRVTPLLRSFCSRILDITKVLNPKYSVMVEKYLMPGVLASVRSI